MNKKRNKTYDRVMSRVYTNSRSSLGSNSVVLRHESPSSVRVGAKPSPSYVNSSAFSELPTVLNDYVLEDNVQKPESSARVSKVVKPRRTLKSLDTSKSPPRTVTKCRSVPVPRILRAEESTPAMRGNEEWSDSHVRQCYSSRSHTRLKDLKDEIKAYRDTEKFLRWRSNMYKKCGVVFDEDGYVASDKAVQAELEEEKDPEEKRRKKWLEIIDRPDLMRPNIKPNSYFICSKHFDTSSMIFVPHLKPDALPTKTQESKRDQATQTNDIKADQASKSTQTSTHFQSENTQTTAALPQNTPRKRKLSKPRKLTTIKFEEEETRI